MPNLFRVIGQFLTRSESASTGNAVQIQNSTPETVLGVANQGRVSIKKDDSVATQSVAVIQNGTSNSGLVLAPNGTGAIMAQVPDGGTAGGNARGQRAVDLQMVRDNANQVASGDRSIICGGQYNRSTNTNSFIGGGQYNVSSGNSSFIGSGNQNTASSTYGSIVGGTNGNAYLYSQEAYGNGSFTANAQGDSQRSIIIFRRSITGTNQTELFLDGSSTRAILALPFNATNARAWRGQIDVVAIVATAGGGGLVINECFMGSYVVGIKREGATTALVGAVATVNEVSDTNMATSVVTIDADNTNEALRIQFTPPTTADGTTVIRVVATAYLTEVGR